MDKLAMPYLIAGGALVGLLLYLSTRPKGYAGELAWGVGSTVVDVADSFVGGAVNSIGDLVGLERTDANKCQRDLAAGNTWDASFSCPAGTFIGSFFK